MHGEDVRDVVGEAGEFRHRVQRNWRLQAHHTEERVTTILHAHLLLVEETCTCAMSAHVHKISVHALHPWLHAKRQHSCTCTSICART